VGDTLDGGSGFDIAFVNLALRPRARRSTSSSAPGVLTLDGGGEIRGVETFVFIAGSGNDSIKAGSTSCDFIWAGRGDDTVVGSAFGLAPWPHRRRHVSAGAGNDESAAAAPTRSTAARARHPLPCSTRRHPRRGCRSAHRRRRDDGFGQTRRRRPVRGRQPARTTRTRCTAARRPTRFRRPPATDLRCYEGDDLVTMHGARAFADGGDGRGHRRVIDSRPPGDPDGDGEMNQGFTSQGVWRAWPRARSARTASTCSGAITGFENLPAATTPTS
jgi:Ca2+-binding RTX toxin-like protein